MKFFSKLRWLKEWWIPAVISLSVLAVVVSCHRPIAPSPHRPLVVSASQTPKPHSVRPEGDRRYREHEKGWEKLHAAQAKSNPDQCMTCHTAESCVSCHQNGIPKSHQAKWVDVHKSDSTCKACHTDKQCQTCHQSATPSSHNKKWLMLHGKNRTDCATCHKQSYCDKCHGMTMPHSSNWQKAHVPVANKSEKQCAKCHQTSFCSDCHAKSKPTDHTADWVSIHNKPAADKALCLKCHSQKFCDTCHKTTKPRSHSPTWPEGHGKIVVEEERVCTTCHDNKKYCQECHGVDMPHPQGYLMKHNTPDASREPGSKCYKCHEQKYCDVCHSVLDKNKSN